MKTFEQLNNELPKSWEEMTLKDFIKITAIVIEEDQEFDGLFTGVDNTIEVISLLTDTPTSYIESLPLYQVQALANKMAFMLELPIPTTKSMIEWKGVNEITYNDFVLYQNNVKTFYQNVPLIIQTFSKNKLTGDQINSMNMVEAYTGFFLLQSTVAKFILKTKLFLEKKAMKQLIKDKMKNLLTFKKKWQVKMPQ